MVQNVCIDLKYLSFSGKRVEIERTISEITKEKKNYSCI